MTCDHTNTQTTILDSGPHYAKTVCKNCGRFLRFEKHPKTVEKLGATLVSLKRLESVKVTAWERQFLKTIAEQGGKMSPKQEEIFNRIVTTYGV